MDTPNIFLIYYNQFVLNGMNTGHKFKNSPETLPAELKMSTPLPLKTMLILAVVRPSDNRS
jgi:hypothetical protein